MEGFEDLGQRVRTHLCYARVFGDALTEGELIERCAPDDPEGVRRELWLLRAYGHVEHVEQHWFLRGASKPGVREHRIASRAATEKILADHRVLLRLLTRLSLVRMLAISGSVAWGRNVGINGKPPDLDLFIITGPGGVHVVRFLLRLWGIGERWLAAWGWRRRRARVCANYITDAGFLGITNPSFYTATDARNVRVLKGHDDYRRFLQANGWISRYYPPSANHAGPYTLPMSPFLHVLNLMCFSILAGNSWLRGGGFSRTGNGTRRRVGEHSLRFRFDRNASPRRLALAGGGYQPQVARRFEEIYTRHFGPDARLQAFLFPGTTATGVHTSYGYADSTIATPLGYHD